MENNKADIPFELKLLYFIGIVAVAFGFILLYSGVGAFVLNLMGISDPTVKEGLSPARTEEIKNSFLIAQFIASLSCLVILPALYLYFLKPIFQVFKLKTNHLFTFLILALLIIFSMMPVINVINEWNQSLHLPSSFTSLENKFKKMEEMAEKTIDLIIYYKNFTEFLMILTVIAVLPAVGEELLFRGIVQNELKALLRNPHIAIWFAGFLFSFVHFQFFGFFPRMLLGVILGYLYYWSGNIIVPMFLHFINNAITLVTMNLVHEKAISFDPNSSKEIPPAFIIFSFTISMVLLYIFWRTNRQNSKTGNA
jgi:membrane protease YdiL (CAAX protease family)